MAVRKPGLGRGLDALLGGSEGLPGSEPETPETTEPKVAAASAPASAGLRELGVDLLERGKYQPRQDMHKESLDELAASIRSQGVVQPIVVRPLSHKPGRYEIIAGERRWRASQIAGLQEVPVVIRDIPDSAAIAVALIENIQRENLNPLEEAIALKRLIDEFEMTHQKAADAVGRSRAAVSNLLRLLELPADIQQMVREGGLEMGHARALLGLPDARSQSEAARKVAAGGLSVRATERLVRGLLNPKPTKPPQPRLDNDTRRLQDELADKLGAKVAIQHSKAGKGKLVVSYNSLDELEGILAHIR